MELRQSLHQPPCEFQLPAPAVGHDGHDGYHLTAEIIDRSVADSWTEARQEWDLTHVYLLDEGEYDTCLCGHHPIREVCVVVNRKNGNMAVVGNVCVKRFLGVPSDPVFRAIRRIQADPTVVTPSELIRYAVDRGWLTGWERGFLPSLARFRRRYGWLSAGQKAKVATINRKVLGLVAASRKGVRDA